MGKKAQQGFPPMRRVLLLKVRGDGQVRAWRVAMRGDRLTYRRNAGLLTDETARAGYGLIFRNARFDAICVRVFVGGRWRNPMEASDAA